MSEPIIVSDLERIKHLKAERDVLVRQVTALQGRCDAAEAEVERLRAAMRDVVQQLRNAPNGIYTRVELRQWADTLAAALEPMTVCQECDGKGRVVDAPVDVLAGRAYVEPCPVCRGTGKEPKV